MKRKEFIEKMTAGVGILLPIPSVLFGTQAAAERIRFGIISDIHQDFFPEAEDRLRQFIKMANHEELDFIIQLGDFAYPLAENKNFLRTWNGYKGPKYHVLGNHDMDRDTKESFLDFVGQSHEKKYFSFDHGGFHFVVLDTNFIRLNDQDIPYEAANYKRYKPEQIGYVSTEQVSWLKDDLTTTDRPTVIFSHQPFNGSAGNGQEILQLINKINIKKKKVIAAFSGHLHHDWCLEIQDVHHVQINSASYLWVGHKFPPIRGRYPDSVEEKFKLLPKMAPYDDALFAVIEIDETQRILDIKGKTAEFVAPSPYDLGYFVMQNQMSPSSSIASRSLKY